MKTNSLVIYIRTKEIYKTDEKGAYDTRYTNKNVMQFYSWGFKFEICDISLCV